MSKAKGKFSGSNPFESNTPKQRFTVLNRTVPGAKKVSSTKAQSKAISKRKKSLLVDLSNLNKDNSFIDHRFGESRKSAEGLSNEDKYLERYQKERMKQLKEYKKKNAFSVEDESDQLTHLGQSLGSVISNVSGAGGRDEGSDFEDNGKVSFEDVHIENFGGGQFEEDKKKIIAKTAALAQYPDPTPDQRAKMSKHEIMIDLMRKAKFFKNEKKASSSSQHDMAVSIDSVYDEIRALMEFNDKNEAMGKSTVDKSLFAAIGIDGKPLLPSEIAEFDEFASEALRLQFEKKALPADRLKSAEEVAKENREKLMRLEKLRLRRMDPNSYDDDDESGDEEAGSDDNMDDTGRKLTMAERRKKRRTEIKEAKRIQKAQDAQEKAIRRAAGEISSDEEDEEDADEDDEDEDDDEYEAEHIQVVASASDKPLKSGLKKTSAFDDGEGNLALDGDFMVDSDDEKSTRNVCFDENVKAAAPSAPRKRGVFNVELNAKGEQNPLPYTFEAPKSYKEFAQLLATRGDNTIKAIQDHETIVQRLCILYNVKANIGNAPKMEIVYRSLFRHIRVVCEETAAKIGSSESKRSLKTGCLAGDKKVRFESLALATAKFDFVTRQIFEMSEMMPKYAAKTCREFIETIYSTINERVVVNAADGLASELVSADPMNLYTQETRSDLPLAHEILGLKLISKLYPVTDYRHNITTPLFILLAETLTVLPIRGGRDIMVGVMIASMLLEFTQESKRFIPEIVSFLQASLVALFDIAPSIASTKAREKAKRVLNKQTDDSKTHIAVEPRNEDDLEYLLAPNQKNFLPSTNFCKMFDIHASRVPYCVSDASDANIAEHDKLPFSLCLLPHNNFNVFKTQAFLQTLLVAISKLVHMSAMTYKNLDTLPELFAPIFASLQAIISRQTTPDATLTENYTAATFAELPFDATIYQRFHALQLYLKFHSKRIQRSRKPLAKFATVVALKEFTPSFEESFNPNKDYDTNKERAELKQLKKKVQREQKSAIREIRRDTQFVAGEKAKQQAKQSAARDNERKRVWSVLDAERQDSNILAGVSKKKARKNLDAKNQHK